MKKWMMGLVWGLATLVVQAEVTISNLTVAQREGTKLVDVSYDVSCDTTNAVWVDLIVSNGVVAVKSPSVTGDVGAGVPTGTSRAMVWNMAADWNGNLSSNMRVGVNVLDAPPPPPPEGMVAIPAGTNSGTDPDFGAYSLTVGDFWMGETEVTNDEMIRVMQWAYDHGKLTMSSSSAKNAQGNQQELLDLDSSYCRITWDGSTFGMKSTKGAGYPCVEVSWYGSVAYCNYRSEMEGRARCYDLSDWSSDLTAKGYRLPTSEEWEYAARGGLSGKRFPWGDTITHNQANYYSSSSYAYDTSSTRGYHPDYDDGGYPYTSPTEIFSPNGYGLSDMSGNVWEWCNDVNGSYRVIRGGSWRTHATYARCGYVDSYYPSYSDYSFGFRALCL